MFDVVNLVVGAIVGADIYVAASFGTGLLGPASILLWVVAGGIAFVLALAFARCAMLVPKVGGAYAYASTAFGRFPGFMVGWSMWLAEWTSLSVFPIAFARYLTVLIPGLSPAGIVAAKVLLVMFLTYTNYLGVKAAGRINDFLTITKLAPPGPVCRDRGGGRLCGTAPFDRPLRQLCPLGLVSFWGSPGHGLLGLRRF